MGILILLVLGIPFFLGLPYFFMRLFCDVCHIRGPRVRIAIYCISVWLLWDHLQLAPDQTGGGSYLASQAAADRASHIATEHSDSSLPAR
jgi:hypothetical protein